MMRHNLPKIVSVLLLICMIFSVTTTFPIHAAETEITFEAGKFSDNDTLRYTVFIYSSATKYAWMTDFISTDNDLTIDGLYMKDNETGTFTHLADNVKEFSLMSDRIYYLTNDNEIAYLDRNSMETTSIYVGKEETVWQLICSEDDVYFAGGETVFRSNREGTSVKTLATLPGMVTFTPISNLRIAWANEESTWQIHDLTANEDEEVASPFSVFNQLEGADGLVSPQVASNASTQASFTSVSLPLSGYGPGNYFNNNNNSPCTCHKRWSGDNPCPTSSCVCRSYRGGIQCYAFAYYVLDQFTHSGSYSDITNSAHHPVDRYYWSSDFGRVTYAEARSFQVGTYLRVGFEPGTSSTHSIFIMGNDGSNITVYQCNYGSTGQGCIISTEKMSYATFCNRYYLFDVIRHPWNTGASNYTPVYHKVTCSVSGCPGYILERHSDAYYATCSSCSGSVLPNSNN